MANVYKDENGHFTNKENNGGPCHHKRINGGKYEKSEDGGKTWAPLKDRKEYDEYEAEDFDFDLNEEDDFGFDEDAHMDYEEIFTDNDTAQIERYAKHYGVDVEELKDNIHQNALDRIRQGDSVTNAKNDAMEEELDRLEPGSVPVNDKQTGEDEKEPNPMDEFSGPDREGPSYAQMEAKKKYEVTLDGDLLGEVEANSPEEAERLAQQRWPNHTDDDLLRVDEKKTVDMRVNEPYEKIKPSKNDNLIEKAMDLYEHDPTVGSRMDAIFKEIKPGFDPNKDTPSENMVLEAYNRVSKEFNLDEKKDEKQVRRLPNDSGWEMKLGNDDSWNPITQEEFEDLLKSGVEEVDYEEQESEEVELKEALDKIYDVVSDEQKKYVDKIKKKLFGDDDKIN